MASILGFGAWLPERVVVNTELAALLGIDAEWILEACGIRERRWAGDESVVDLAEKAAREAIANSGMEPSSLGGIIVGTGTPDRQFPGVSAQLQARLDCPGIPVFDVHLASSGGLVALCLAARLCEQMGPVLVVGAEKMSSVIQRDLAKETAILFGDGAGAAVVSAGAGPLEILDAKWGSDGAFAEDLKLDFGGPLHMHGRSVIMQANRKITGAVQDLLQGNAVDAADVELFLFHQANLNLLRQIGKTLGIDPARVPITLDRYGNTSAASVLIAAAEAWKEGRFAQGSKSVMAAFGAGFSWGAALLEAR